MCCVCVSRTGQYACGRWTVTVVRCTVWPGAPATLMLWAPSPAQGNIPAATPLFLIASTDTDMFKKRGELGNDLPSLHVFLSRIKASFIVSGSQDCTVKVWDLPADLTTTGVDVHQLTPRTTEKAHDKVQTKHSTHVSGSRNSLQSCLELMSCGTERRVHSIHMCKHFLLLATSKLSAKDYF